MTQSRFESIAFHLPFQKEKLYSALEQLQSTAFQTWITWLRLGRTWKIEVSCHDTFVEQKWIRPEMIKLRKYKLHIAKSKVLWYNTWVSAVRHYGTQGGARMFSYNKLWKMLIDRNMMKKDLMAETNITSSTMGQNGKGLTCEHGNTGADMWSAGLRYRRHSQLCKRVIVPICERRSLRWQGTFVLDHSLKYSLCALPEARRKNSSVEQCF